MHSIDRINSAAYRKSVSSQQEQATIIKNDKQQSAISQTVSLAETLGRPLSFRATTLRLGRPLSARFLCSSV